MRIREIRSSVEACNEAGWFAFDFILEESLSDADILRFRPLGSFLYLSSLKKPFFKSEGDYFHIKGIKGEFCFQMAVHGEHRELLESIRKRLEEAENPEEKVNNPKKEPANGEQGEKSCTYTQK